MTPEEWRAVKDLFAEARERPGPERPAWLDRACAGEPERRRQVESLLESAEESWSLLDGPPAASLAVAPLPGEADARIGRRIGAYEVVSEIGQGGMGTVYLARRADGQFDQTVALKLVKRGMDTDAVLARFRQERGILARLHHPHIAQLYGGGATQEGVPYLLMEHIDGEPLIEYCERRRLPASERLKLFRLVCSAVHYAHRNLVVHRDIKPSNILVTADGVPKLLDFGIAKLTESGESERTATGLRAMTPDYASPEQIRGEPVTTATDVYSLGVVLYQLLTGRRPYRVKTGEPEEMARVVCEHEPERPGAFAPELKGDVENIVLMAMRREPDRRYASAEQLAEDIRLHLEGRPILARKDTVGYRTGKLVRRHRVAAAASLLVVVSILAGLSAALWEARVARTAEARAVRRFEDVRKLATSFLFEIQDSIKDLAGSTPARELLVHRGIEYLDSLASEAGDDPRVMRDLAQGYRKLGELQGDFGSGSATLGDTDGSIQSYRKAQAIQEALVRTKGATAEDRLALADLYSGMSDPIARRGETAAAVALGRRAVAIGESLVPAGPSVGRRLPHYYRSLGVALKLAGRGPEALEPFRKNVELAERLFAAEPENVGAGRSAAIAHLKAGDTLGELGQLSSAVAEYRAGLAIETRLAARQPANAQLKRDLSFFHQNLAEVLRKSGDAAGAVKNSLETVEIRRELTAADPKNSNPRLWLATAHAELGEDFVVLGDLASAMPNLREAIALFDSVLAVTPGEAIALQELAWTQGSLGRAYRKEFSAGGGRERLREAQSWLEKSRKTYADLQSRGRLPAEYAKDVDEVTRDLAACREEIERLQNSRLGHPR